MEEHGLASGEEESKLHSHYNGRREITQDRYGLCAAEIWQLLPPEHLNSKQTNREPVVQISNVTLLWQHQ